MNVETYENIPTKIWMVCYKGNSGKWLLSGPLTDYENVIFFASIYSTERETHILEYDLSKNTVFINEPVKKIPKKKVRKVRQVV